MDASIAVLNTELAVAASVFVWILMDLKFLKKPTLVGATTASLTGLVAITAAAGYVSGYGALLIGVSAGIVPWIALNKLSSRLKIDDAASVFPVHGVAGLMGGLLTGILADPTVTQFVDPGLKGALYGNPALLVSQTFAAVIVVAYVFLVTYGLFKLIGRFMPLQESTDDMKVGEEAIHGETAYDFSED